MAGIYIHIPFCKQRCNYCDFYKTTQVLKKPELVEALKIELKQRKNQLDGDTVKTVYFGGGTPSLLSIAEITGIIDAIYSNYKVDSDIEITLESNPDDLTLSQIQKLKQTAVNRLSIGIQSFQNEQLKLMNRRHNSAH
jgi:oxygen-independent coproporphyrinogen-3 oxidase